MVCTKVYGLLHVLQSVTPVTTTIIISNTNIYLLYIIVLYLPTVLYGYQLIATYLLA